MGHTWPEDQMVKPIETKKTHGIVPFDILILTTAKQNFKLATPFSFFKVAGKVNEMESDRSNNYEEKDIQVIRNLFP